MAADLAEYVGADKQRDAAFVQECTRRATALLSRRLDLAALDPDIADALVLELGADLYWRRRARNGVQMSAGVDQVPVRVRADPYAAVDAIIARVVGPGIA